MYGRKITPNLRAGTPDHLYLPGPHRGVWNEAALMASKEIILCEALIDALTFWCAGYRNVTTSYGVNGFTEEHRAAFQKHGTSECTSLTTATRPERSRRQARRRADGDGHRVLPGAVSKGQDANECALKTQPAAKALGVFLNSAAWLGRASGPCPHSAKRRCHQHRSKQVAEQTPTPTGENPEPAAKEKNTPRR